VLVFFASEILGGLVSSTAVTWQAAEKDPYASLRSIASRQSTADVRLRSSIFRAPRLWIFLSSLQGAFFSNLIRASTASRQNRKVNRKLISFQGHVVFPGDGPLVPKPDPALPMLEHSCVVRDLLPDHDR